MKANRFICWAAFLLALVFGPAVWDAPGGIAATDVFVSGQDGYHTYRIPALLVTGKGTVLAFCEGRRNSPADDGNIDLLLKRSGDGGRTWSKAIVVRSEAGPVTMGNPCPINGREPNAVRLLFTRNNKRLFHTRSDDDGRTWAEPRELTPILTGFKYPVVRLGTGPVHGIRLKSGRLVAPLWVSDRERGEQEKDPAKQRYQAGILYSDDEGKTWAPGGLVPPTVSRLNECTVIERADGSLLLNLRAHGAGYRAVATSSDGGLTWSKPALDNALPCPTCQASLLGTGNGEVLFLNPAVSKTDGYHGPSRRNLTLRLSLDDGRTWPIARVLHAGPAGYSDLATVGEDRIVCLYENGLKDYREKISIAGLRRSELIGDRKE